MENKNDERILYSSFKKLKIIKIYNNDSSVLLNSVISLNQNIKVYIFEFANLQMKITYIWKSNKSVLKENKCIGLLTDIQN